MKTAQSRHIGSAHENITTADERAVIAQMSKLGSIAIDPAHVEVVVALPRDAARCGRLSKHRTVAPAKDAEVET